MLARLGSVLGSRFGVARSGSRLEFGDNDRSHATDHVDRGALACQVGRQTGRLISSSDSLGFLPCPVLRRRPRRQGVKQSKALFASWPALRCWASPSPSATTTGSKGSAESDAAGDWTVEVPGQGAYSVQLDEDTLPDGTPSPTVNPIETSVDAGSQGPPCSDLGSLQGTSRQLTRVGTVAFFF